MKIMAFQLNSYTGIGIIPEIDLGFFGFCGVFMITKKNGWISNIEYTHMNELYNIQQKHPNYKIREVEIEAYFPEGGRMALFDVRRANLYRLGPHLPSWA